ncbi:MAG: hypothetical protein LBI48_02125 [Burkholderiaceae bacterium]|jgi:hypothetical protein|nr:hypothetical protein [Burkholderiaceae bacterium]
MNVRNKGDLNVYLVTVQRERVVTEGRVVQVIAYTPESAKMIAKQKRPNEGWEYVPVHRNLNSGSTTKFGPSHVSLIGPADGLPSDGQERHAVLNDSKFIVKVKGEF